MVRDTLYITVPSLFRCPISMDVMKSPVSLCTGVTYDRSSIQHWLDAGHDTCPATMQTLPSKDFVPNLTLRRLINLWAQSHGPPSPSSSSSVSVSVSDQQVNSLIQDLNNQNEIKNSNIARNLSSVADFASFSDENRRILANFEGFIYAIVGAMSRRGGTKMEVLELVIKVLNLILLDNRGREEAHRLISKRIQDFLTSVRQILLNASLETKIESARVLRSIANDDESKRAISENRDLLTELFNLLNSESDQALHDAALSCLIAISATRSTKAQLVELGIVKLLATTISDRRAKKSLAENAMKLLSIVSTCAEGRSAISEDLRCVAAVVERLMKVSKAATEDGVAVLWSVCCLLGERKTKEAVVRSNGVARILLVMQSGYCEGHPVRRMCGDLLRVLRVGCSSDGFGLGSYESKTTHILPC